MLNEKNDNKFLYVLSDIDEKLVGEYMEDSVDPVTVDHRSKKSRFFKLAIPAASLAVVAAVGIGALIIGKNTFSPLEGNTAITESEPVSTDTEQTDTRTENEEPTSETNFDPNTIPSTNGISAPELSTLIIPDILNYSTDINVAHDEIITAAVIDRKICGDYEFSLVGSGIFTDHANSSENIIFAHSLMLLVKKSGEMIDFRDVYDPADPESAVFRLMKDHLDCYTEIAEFGENNEFVVIFRSLKNTMPVPEALFFFVMDDIMYDCKRSDIPSNSKRVDRSETLSAVISTDIETYEDFEDLKTYILTDELTGNIYRFDGIYTDEKTLYYILNKRRITENVSEIPMLNINTVPAKNPLSSYKNTSQFLNEVISEAIISQTTVNGYTFTLIAENFWRDSDDVLFCYNCQTVITEDESYIGVISANLPENQKYYYSFMLSSNGNYSALIPKVYLINDVLLIINSDLEQSRFGEGSFFAVYKDKLHPLSGYWPGMTNTDPPAWTEGQQGYDLIVDTEAQTVIYGFMKFEFDFSSIPAMYNYTVSWLKEPIE